MNFTVEETNLISIYQSDTRAGVLQKLHEVRPYYSDDEELLGILDSVIHKLDRMTNDEFLITSFVPIYPVMYDESITEDFTER